jgi:hypothetical protein
MCSYFREFPCQEQYKCITHENGGITQHRTSEHGKMGKKYWWAELEREGDKVMKWEGDGRMRGRASPLWTERGR